MNITLTGVTGALNSGDQELCTGTIRLLHESFPTAQIRGIHRNPELQARHFPQVEWLPQIGASYSTYWAIRRCTNVLELGVAALGAACRHHDCRMLPKSARESYRALTEADLVVGCAGGWLEDHYVSIWTNLVHLSIATANGVPLVFAPQSIGPFNRKASSRLASLVLERAQGIATREQISFDYARAMGLGASNLRLFPDLALFAENADHEGASRLLHKLCGPDIPDLAGTTLMPWSFPGAADPVLEMARYLDKVEAVIRLLHERTGLKTFLMRQIRDDKGYQGDGGLLLKMAARTPECSILCPDYLEPALLRGVIARCQVFWGSRMHSNIFAATQRVPVVTVAYQHKAEGIMQMLGLGDYVVWIDSFQSEHLVDLIQTALAESDSLRAVLDSSFATILPQWEQLKIFIRESASGRPRSAEFPES
jgi:colanic acid/amylovoran biosynthesis protein